MDYSFNDAHFCKYNNNLLVKPVYVKVLKEGESEYKVVAFFSTDRSVLFLSSPLENA